MAVIYLDSMIEAAPTKQCKSKHPLLCAVFPSQSLISTHKPCSVTKQTASKDPSSSSRRVGENLIVSLMRDVKYKRSQANSNTRKEIPANYVIAEREINERHKRREARREVTK